MLYVPGTVSSLWVWVNEWGSYTYYVQVRYRSSWQKCCGRVSLSELFRLSTSNQRSCSTSSPACIDSGVVVCSLSGRRWFTVVCRCCCRSSVVVAAVVAGSLSTIPLCSLQCVQVSAVDHNTFLTPISSKFYQYREMKMSGFITLAHDRKATSPVGDSVRRYVTAQHGTTDVVARLPSHQPAFRRMQVTLAESCYQHCR